MRLNLSTQGGTPEPEQPAPGPQLTQMTSPAPPRPSRTFPADEIVWGIVIRNGFDEMDDPWYHRGTTQHAYLEGNDNVAICGFRPPQSGPRTRRRPRLGLPTTGDHPMCGMCARMVVAPRPRVPVAVQTPRRAVAIPVNGGAPTPAPAAAPASAAAAGPAAAPVEVAPRSAAGAATAAHPAPGGPVPAPPVAAPPQPSGPVTSPWVRRASSDGQPQQGAAAAPGGAHDSGLRARGIHTETKT